MLIAAGIAAVLLFLWQIASVLLLAFGGILLAVGLRAAAAFVSRCTKVPQAWALWLTAAGLALTLAWGGWLLGGQVASQLDELWRRLPDTVQAVRETIRGSAVGSALPDLETLAGGQSNPLRELGVLTSTTLGGIGDVLLIVVIGLYLAANPAPYRSGLLALVPLGGRGRTSRALAATGEALRLWLVGKVIAMVAVGGITAAGLSLIGVPLALSLGIIAGLLDFVPFFGPIVAAVPGLLIAFSSSPLDALYAAGVYAGVQQLEGNLITPLVQKQAVHVEPVLLILGVVAFGLVFGFLGVVFGAPLVVVATVLVKKLYVEQAPGEGDGRG
ncbi:MAG: AI-2E family transporter [Rhodospirillales bacterium]|nr:AI-2E family transporter [Rhodospirillales bacterium]